MKIQYIILTVLILSSALPYPNDNISNLLAKPYIPESNSVVLETLPASRDPQIKNLHSLRNQLSKTPNDLALAIRLARAYLQLGHTKADPRYDGYAQAALAPWWSKENPPPDVLILRATLRQRRHDFDQALKDLTQVLTVQPNNPQAWLTQAVIQQVQGNYRDARRSCLPLLRLTSSLISTACMANASSLNSQAEENYQSLEKVVSNAIDSASQEKLWALTLLAEMASRLGNDASAERHFLEALNIDEKDNYLLGAYSDFLLEHRRATEVQALLEGTVKSDGLLLRLALAEQQLNTSKLEKHVSLLKARFAENELRGEARHLREEARFSLHLLHQPTQALALAQKNWDIQREHWDARILLEAAIQSENHSAAQPVIDALIANDTEDTQLKRLIGQLL
ncbi:MAG: tetratricopeptide repeat protein [Nitrospirales bacterium]